MRKYSLSLLTSTLLVLLAISLSACSGSKSPVEPMIKDSNSSVLPESSINPPVNRDVIAIYDATIDPAAETFTIKPCERDAAYHFPLTQWYPRVLQITGYGWTPNFWVDIKLKHPFPGTGIKGYDPRVIAILPANPGVSFNYPTLNINANNSVLLEPDGYTKLFDNLGGSILGNTNPFKAYFKDQPNRVWSGTGVTEETQRWQMNLAGFGGPLKYKLVVDVSTNYPNPPQPIIDNAPEPVEIRVEFKSGGLFDGGGRVDVNVILLDWQGAIGIGGVKIEAPNIFNNIINLAYIGPGPNPNEYVFSGTIQNELMVSPGIYNGLVFTWDQLTGTAIFKEFPIEVVEGWGWKSGTLDDWVLGHPEVFFQYPDYWEVNGSGDPIIEAIREVPLQYCDPRQRNFEISFEVKIWPTEYKDFVFLFVPDKGGVMYNWQNNGDNIFIQLLCDAAGTSSIIKGIFPQQAISFNGSEWVKIVFKWELDSTSHTGEAFFNIYDMENQELLSVNSGVKDPNSWTYKNDTMSITLFGDWWVSGHQAGDEHFAIRNFEWKAWED